MTRDDLLGLLAHDNVAAFLRVIREGESNQDESAFTLLYGGGHFDSFDDHPRIYFPLPDGRKTSAAGAFQEVASSWDDFCKAMGEKLPFTPENQALCAVWLINRAGATDPVLRGELDAAIRKLSPVWTSLGTAKIQKIAHGLFEAYGGKSGSPAQPVSTSASTKPEVTHMPAILAALLPSLLQSIPELIHVFGSDSDSEVRKRNQAAGVVVADTLIKATNAVNLQDAADKVASDPVALQAARDALAPMIAQLTEVGGGGIAEARKVAFSSEQPALWKNAAFVISLIFSPLIYLVAIEILFNPSKQQWSDDIKMMFVTAIVTGLLGAITGFFLGSSLQQGGKRATDK